jgi:surfactin synthase thioesterase subunit
MCAQPGQKMSDKTIEDFRQNEFLRGLVKREIMNEHIAEFKSVHEAYLPIIQTIKEQIIEVEPNFKFE